MERVKKVVLPYHYSPHGKLVHVVVKLRDIPGSLSGLLSLLSTRVNLIGSTSYSLGEGSAIYSCFAETLLKSETAESLRKVVEMSPWVVESQVWESKDGLLIDSFHSGMRIGLGDSYIMLPSAGVSEIFERLVRVFGTGGQTILYQLGYDFGSNRFKKFEPILGRDPIKRFKEASHIYEALGYGNTTLVEGKQGELPGLVVYDCFECSFPTDSKRSCAFMRGLAAGSFSEALKEPVGCEEVHCRLRGDKYCELVLQRKEAHRS